MAERRSWRAVGSVESSVALAVSLRDYLTGERPRREPHVTVDGEPPDARSASGIALYFDLPAATVDLAVDGGDEYADVERSVDVSNRDPADPVTVELRPAPAYRLPTWATAIRGRVHRDDEPVAGADVRLDLPTAPSGDQPDPYERYRDRAVETDGGGEYLLVLPEASSIADDGANVAVDGSDPTVTVSLPSGIVVSSDLTVPVGAVTRHDVDLSE